MTLDVQYFVGSNEFSTKIMNVMSTVPRHRFVLEEQQLLAYENHPLTIGYGQTISQPYIVALMSDILHVNSEHLIFEVGTGIYKCAHHTRRWILWLARTCALRRYYCHRRN